MPMKFISSTRNDWNPQYSPDGKRIAFTSERSGAEELWICDSDGANAIQLTHFGRGFVTNPLWSPDSSRLTFYSSIEGHSEVYVINASGGKPRRLTFSAGSTDSSWSRDGQWIYFSSVDAGRIYKMPAEGGPAVLVNSNLSGWSPTESLDGRFIYFRQSGPDSNNLAFWRIPIEGGDSKLLLNSVNGWGPAFAAVDDGIYFIPSLDPAKGCSIQFLELATGKIKTITELGKQPCGNLSISPDRRWALYSQQDQAGSDLMLVENFR